MMGYSCMHHDRWKSVYASDSNVLGLVLVLLLLLLLLLFLPLLVVLLVLLTYFLTTRIKKKYINQSPTYTHTHALTHTFIIIQIVSVSLTNYTIYPETVKFASETESKERRGRRGRGGKERDRKSVV